MIKSIANYYAAGMGIFSLHFIIKNPKVLLRKHAWVWLVIMTFTFPAVYLFSIHLNRIKINRYVRTQYLAIASTIITSGMCKPPIWPCYAYAPQSYPGCMACINRETAHICPHPKALVLPLIAVSVDVFMV
jgi:hypothetical protein